MNNHLLPPAYRRPEDQVWYPILYKTIAQWLYALHVRQQTSSIRASFAGKTASTLPRRKGKYRHASESGTSSASSPLVRVRIVCISDTHNSILQDVPDGDVLLHAGDLTRHGTFDELQAQLDWIAALPHKYKVVIAGNHDLLLDSTFTGGSVRSILNESGGSEDEAVSGKRKEDLDWKDIIYLQDSSVTLRFPASGKTDGFMEANGFHEAGSNEFDESAASDKPQASNKQPRTLKIYGTPKVPECGNWAFQYLAVNDTWSGTIPDDVDIVMVHTPPALYCDNSNSSSSSSSSSSDGDGGDSCNGKDNFDFRNGSVTAAGESGKGDGYLLQELTRVKPQLVVCGHLHDGYGQRTLVHDELCRLKDHILLETKGVVAVLRMGFLVLGSWLHKTVLSQLIWHLGTLPGSIRSGDDASTTTVVNAAVSPGEKGVKDKAAIAVNILV